MGTTTDELFGELKREAITIWQGYDDTHGYASEKIAYINSIKNVQDNYGTFIGMFDVHNQRKLYDAVSDDGKKLIDEWVGGLTRVEKLAKELGL